jgi:hypothetical protein
MQLKEMGVPLPDEALIEACTIQNKSRIIEMMQKSQQQAQQMQQVQMQAAMEEQAARTNLANKRAIADEGLGVERYSRVQENQALAVERRAEAEKDHAVTLLNLVKVLKEMDMMDIDQLRQLMDMQHAIKDQSRQDEAIQEARSAATMPSNEADVASKTIGTGNQNANAQ